MFTGFLKNLNKINDRISWLQYFSIFRYALNVSVLLKSYIKDMQLNYILQDVNVCMAYYMSAFSTWQIMYCVVFSPLCYNL